MHTSGFPAFRPVFLGLVLVLTLIGQLHGYDGETPFTKQFNEHDFLAACREGRLDVVKEWLDKEGFNPNDSFTSGKTGDEVTGLLLAAQNGYLSIVQALLNKGADPNKGKWAPLVYAAIWGRIEVVSYLLENGADPEMTNFDSGCSALQAAVKGGQISIVDLLLERHVDINKSSDKFDSPLCYAVKYTRAEVVKKLLQFDADPNKLCKDGYSVLSKAISQHNNVIALELIGKNADVNRIEPDGSNALTIAARVGNDSGVDILLKNGADINWVEPNGASALSIAIDKGSRDIVNILLKSGADISHRRPLFLCYQETALGTARRHRLRSRLFRLVNPGMHEQYTGIVQDIRERQLAVSRDTLAPDVDQVPDVDVIQDLSERLSKASLGSQQSPPHSKFGTPRGSVCDEDDTVQERVENVAVDINPTVNK